MRPWLACYDFRSRIRSLGDGIRLQPKRFIMNAGRTTKQGQQINVGKDSAEYQATVSTVTMHAEDMKAAGINPPVQLPAVGRTRITPRRITAGLATTLAGFTTTLGVPVRR